MIWPRPAGPVLTTVSTINPIRVYFQANERSYLTFWRHYAFSRGTNQDLTLELILSDDSVFPQKGRFFYADRQVNPTTGTLQIAGLFPNPDFTLRPGQYALVRAQTQVKTNAILVPQRAVTEAQGTYQVAVVGSDNKTKIQHVKVGNQIGSNWIVEDGLKPGDRIVVEGTLKAKAGTLVNPKPLAGASGQSQPVAAGILPAVEGGILPPGDGHESSGPTAIPPGRMPGSTAGRMPAATPGAQRAAADSGH